MDPLIAAAERVVGYLIPYALDKGTELAKRIGKSAVDRIGGWLDSLRERWAGDDDASKALGDFERTPEANRDRLRDLLAERLRSDPSLKESVEQLAAAVGPTVIVTMRGGNVDIQKGPEFGKVLRGEVSVEQTLVQGKEMTGPTFGDIGG
jgi:hypothetical protein